MHKGRLTRVSKLGNGALYQISNSNSNILTYCVSTEPTRAILNNPEIVGVNFTNLLRVGITSTLKLVKSAGLLADLAEDKTVVLTILRGGLNFCVRESLFEAFGFNTHTSAFMGSQRSKDINEHWFVIKTDYKSIPDLTNKTVFIGDIAATGTTLSFVLRDLLPRNPERVVLITIGTHKSEKVLSQFDTQARKTNPNYKGSTIIYLEGKFVLADSSSKARFRIVTPGTDLLRTGAIMTPEFESSQYDSVTNMLQKCVIYDGGNRSFSPLEYMEEVHCYWREVLALAKDMKMTAYDAYIERDGQLKDEHSFVVEKQEHFVASQEICQDLKDIYTKRVALHKLISTMSLEQIADCMLAKLR